MFEVVVVCEFGVGEATVVVEVVGFNFFDFLVCVGCY